MYSYHTVAGVAWSKQAEGVELLGESGVVSLDRARMAKPAGGQAFSLLAAISIWTRL